MAGRDGQVAQRPRWPGHPIGCAVCLLAGLTLLDGHADAHSLTPADRRQAHALEAFQAAVDCRFDDALRLARSTDPADPATKLFSQFVVASVYVELGQTGAASWVIARMAEDPALNPAGGSNPAPVEEGAAEVLAAIRQTRGARTGSTLCLF